MTDLIKKIKSKMEERNYTLVATSGENKVLHYSTPFGETPNFNCEIHIKAENDVQFKFKYVTEKCLILSTDLISGFFDDERFKRFECEI